MVRFLAVLSTLAATHTKTQLATGASSLGALTSGYQLAFGVGALICLLGAVATVLLLRPASAETGVPAAMNAPARPTGCAAAASSRHAG